MSIEDFQPDTAYTTPSGQVLPKQARNPHPPVDVPHGNFSGGGDGGADECCGCSISTQVVEYDAPLPSQIPEGYTAYEPLDRSYLINEDALTLTVAGFVDSSIAYDTYFPPGTNYWLDSQPDFDTFLSDQEVARSLTAGALADALIPSYYNDSGVVVPVILVKNGTILDINDIGIKVSNSILSEATIPFTTLYAPAPLTEKIFVSRLIEKDCETGDVTQTFVDNDSQVIPAPVTYNLVGAPAERSAYIKQINTSIEIETLFTSVEVYSIAIYADGALFDISINGGVNWIEGLGTSAYAWGNGINKINLAGASLRPNSANLGAAITIVADISN